MPFDKKISTKRRTLKCHFTPLMSPGTGVKQRTGSKAGRRIQWAVHCPLPSKRTVHTCFSFGCSVINTMPSRRPIRVQMSSLDMTSVLLAAVECWVTLQGTPLSVLYSNFIDVQNSLFTIQKRICIVRRSLISIYREGFVLFFFFKCKNMTLCPSPPLPAHVS